MKYKLSQWHNGNIKPVHIGVYERRFETINNKLIFGSLWTGKEWNWLYRLENKKAAARERNISNFQSMEWRGIIK